MLVATPSAVWLYSSVYCNTSQRVLYRSIYVACSNLCCVIACIVTCGNAWLCSPTHCKCVDVLAGGFGKVSVQAGMGCRRGLLAFTLANVTPIHSVFLVGATCSNDAVLTDAAIWVTISQAVHFDGVCRPVLTAAW